MTFFPLLLASISGFQILDDRLLYLTQSMGATRWQVFRYVELPLLNELGCSVGGRMHVIGGYGEGRVDRALPRVAVGEIHVVQARVVFERIEAPANDMAIRRERSVYAKLRKR